jgi:glycosyltransferase involved in cell wall biosynthesis
VLAGAPPLLYVYPQWHAVSFTLVARKHVEYIRRLGLARVYELDELAFPSYMPHLKYVAVVHPWIYVYHRLVQARLNALDESLRHRLPEYLAWWRSHYGRLVAVDVCDSDRISDYAVELLNRADAAIVPSSFCAEVYRASGVRVPVHRVPHGVDPEWYTMPSAWETAPAGRLSPALVELYLYKRRKGRRFLLFWLFHSPERKGWPEVRETYRRLAERRRDAVLVLKTVSPNSPAFQEVMHLGAVQVHGWLDELDKMALYDLADITLVFSRGGGFELNCLESLARGVPCVAGYWGSWRDYLPPFLGVRAGGRVRVFPDSAIHAGHGYRVDVEDAAARIEDVLDSYDEYRARVEEWRRGALAREYRWDLIARQLVSVALGSAQPLISAAAPR